MWRTALTGSAFQAGCPIAAGALAGPAAPAARVAAAKVFEHWQQRLTSVLQARGVDTHHAASQSTVILSAIEGADILAIAARSLTPLDRVAAHLSQMIDSSIAS